MNKRIRELAREAGGHNNISKFRGHFLPPEPGYIDPATVDFEKFAELIVRECAEVVQEGRWMVPPSQEQLARSIKQHFGVEE